MIDDKEIIKYYGKLDRALFMGNLGNLSAIDSAFPIGYGQTISQPSLVLKMTVMLELTGNDRVLEVGTGSGYQTALLSPFADVVFTVERIEPLMSLAKKRLEGIGCTNIRFLSGDGSRGWEEHAPYDRIIVTAAAHRIPEKLKEQLAPGGIMVIPVGGDIQRINIVRKDTDGRISIDEMMPVVFVKLKGDY